MEKTIIIMTKSFKRYNYCIAGIDVETGEWIRVVSDDRTIEGAVPVEDAVDENENPIEIFDVVTISFIRSQPLPEQDENWLYDRSRPWIKQRSVNLQYVINQYGTDNCQYVFNNDARFLERDELTGQSLLLLKISSPKVIVKTFPNQKKVSLNFRYNNESYAFFSISDIEVYNEYKIKDDGTYPLGDECYAVFSLTRPHVDNRCYKMVASIF